jgi:hypothetical protein
MSDAVTDTLSAAPAPPDRRIVLTAAASVALHLMLLGWLLLPRMQLPEPAEPPAVNVDLVPSPPEAASEPPASSAAPSSEPLSSADGSASSAEAVSSVAPPSQAASAAASEAPAASAPPSASEGASQEVAGAKPVVIPVGPSDAASDEASSVESSAPEEPSSAASDLSSAEASSAAEEGAPSELTAAGAGDGGAAKAAAPAAEAPPITGALHVAKRFYLAAMLDAPAMARAREAIKTLPRDKRLVQTCNIEAVGQLGNAGRGFDPDAVIADALAMPAASGSTFTVTGGAFRSDGRWRALAYTCTLSPDLGAVRSFSYRVGDDVTATLKSRLGG